MLPPAPWGYAILRGVSDAIAAGRAPPWSWLSGCGSFWLGGASRGLAGLVGGRLMFTLRRARTPARGFMARPTACALLPPPRLRCSYPCFEGRRGTGARLGTSRPPRPCSRWSCCREPRSSPRPCAPAPPPKSGVRSGLRPSRAYLSATAGTLAAEKSYQWPSGS